MSIPRDTIQTIVLDILKELGEDLKIPALLEADENTRLFGARSALDSMNLVNVIAEIEDRLSEEHAIDITLADERAMSLMHSPFRSVGSCVDYIEALTSAPS